MCIPKCPVKRQDTRRNATGLRIKRTSLVLILRDVARFSGFLRRLVQKVLSLVFDPMLSLWGIFVCYK